MKTSLLLTVLMGSVVFADHCVRRDNNGVDWNLNAGMCPNAILEFYGISPSNGQDWDQRKCINTCEMLAEMTERLIDSGIDDHTECCNDFEERLGCLNCDWSFDHILDEDNNCNDCDRIGDIAGLKDADDKLCCSQLVGHLLLETSHRKLLGSNTETEDCVTCKEIGILSHNVGCEMYPHNTCYLRGKSYDGSYGQPPMDSVYNHNNNYYQTNQDYTTGYYSGEHQSECTYETVRHYYGELPTTHSDGKATSCPPCSDKCSSSDYMLTSACVPKNCPAYDASTTFASETDTTSSSVNTVGWVMIAISGVLFLASIAFYMAGRNERKVAAEDRLAGHGVMA